jgi:flavodoxin
MRTLVVYDSLYGNTEKIARAIAEAISGEVEVIRVGEANPSDLASFDLFVIGSPTQGGRATQAVREFISGIPKDALKKVGVASFDTRISGKDRGIGVRILIGVIGYAAGKIASALKKKGGNPVASPEGFFVEDKEGPIKKGEIERAESWARAIAE